VDRAHLEAWAAFVQAHAAVVTAVERDLVREHDLTLSSFEVLSLLAREPGGSMRMQDLARGALLTKSGMTRLVDRMQGLGLLDRRPCAEDGRVVYAALTASGRKALTRALPLFHRSVEEHFAALLSGDEAGAFLGTLRALIEGNGEPVREECHSQPRLAATS
jgi:DNA-binding MarR family transcriptional regulator